MQINNYINHAKHDTPLFSNINQDDFPILFEVEIAKSKQEIQAIVKNEEQPTFKNTLEALAYSSMDLEVLSNIFFNLNSAMTNDGLQKIAQQVAPLLAQLSNDISLNEDLFQKVKLIYDQREELHLTKEQATLLENNYKGFVRNGALLNELDKERLREIDTQLSQLSLTFGENVLADTHNYELHLTEDTEVEGLPETALEQAKELAESKGKKGWMFTLDYPSYIPFTTYAKNRELRKELTIQAGKKGFQKNKNNNEHIVLEIVRLRFERANLLGYPTHADFVLEQRMAKNPSTVLEFLNNLLTKAEGPTKKEFEELQVFAKNLDGIDTLEKWDSAYYAEKLKQEKYAIDDEILKPYFQLENVLQGAFDIAKRLYALNFKEVFDIDKYHKEVRTFEVFDDNNRFIAVFYTDFFPRKEKRNGAWMTSFRPQYRKDNIDFRPQVSIVCNFTKPTTSKPSLLSFNEVTTLFHEFGHALHGMLADTIYPSLSGTNVYWDFVELPSQIMENWCYEPQALQMFAKHYQTHQVIPMELINKIKDSANFLQGMATLRQLSFGLLDMAWHGQDPRNIKDLKHVESQAFKTTQLFPDVEKNAMSTAFSHIFQGGYSAGYYSYKWAEVLDADAFAYFQEQGIFDKKVADSFKNHILSQGGTEHPMDLYQKFKGQKPNPDALLKRAGLL